MESGPSRRSGWPYLALVAGGVCIGFASIFVRLSHAGPVASAFWRLALATPILFSMAWFQCRREDRAFPGPTWGSLAMGLLFATDLGLWHWSIRFTTIANANLLGNFAAIHVGIFAWVFWKQRQGFVFVASLVAAIAGMLLLSGARLDSTPQARIGDGLAFATAIVYAAYMLVVSRARQRTEALPLIAWSSLASAVVLLPVALLTPADFLPVRSTGWAALVALALVSQVAGQSLITWAFARISATFSAVTLLLQPVVATLVAWCLFGETLTGTRLVGAVLVLSGIATARLFAK